MKHFRRYVMCAAVATIGVAGPVAAQSGPTLLVAEPVHGTGYLPLYVAIDNGYFTKKGLNVKILTVESGSGHTNAVLSGQAFAFIGGPEHDAFAKLKGAELRSVVNIVDRGNVYFMAAKGMEPKPGEDMAAYFKGKVIATGAFGGTPNSITRYLLKKWNLNEKTDVTMQELPNAAIPAAIKTHNAVIGVTSEPFITQGIKQGFWDEPIINIPKELGPYAYSTLNVRLESIQKDPDTVRKFVEGMIEGLQFTYAHPDEAVKIARKEFPTMSPDDLKATLDRSFADEMWSKDGTISRASWETAKAVVLAAGVLKQDVPYDQIIDTQFIKAAGTN
jgi:NitT/TauT family transport system substrate-binding protein